MTAQRATTVLLIALLLIFQAQLWFGRGSVASVAKLRADIEAAKLKNNQASIVNSRLVAEIQDLREGTEMAEEHARQELGMVKPDEIFVQVAK